MTDKKSIDNTPAPTRSDENKARLRRMKTKLEKQYRENWRAYEKRNIESSSAVEAALRFIVY